MRSTFSLINFDENVTKRTYINRQKITLQLLFIDHIKSTIIVSIVIIIHASVLFTTFYHVFPCEIVTNNENVDVVVSLGLFMFMSHYVYCCFKSVSVWVIGVCGSHCATCNLVQTECVFHGNEKPKSSNEMPKKLLRKFCQKAITHALNLPVKLQNSLPPYNNHLGNFINRALF